MDIFISVIIPMYNSSQFLEIALQSLMKQTIQEIEFIIINDGSTDNSHDIVQNFLKSDLRFKYFYIENNGYGHALNYGISLSNGNYIAFFEPDDYINITFYEELANIAKQIQNDIIKYNGIYTDTGGIIKKLFTFQSMFLNKTLTRNEFPRFWTAHPSIINGIYKKSFLNCNNISFCEGKNASYQDVQFTISLYYSNPTILILSSAGYFYRKHENQSTTIADTKIIDIYDNWKLQYAWVKEKNFPMSFYMFRTFYQFLGVYKKTKTFNAKYNLLKNIVKISQMTKLDSLTYTHANFKQKFLYFIISRIGCISKFNFIKRH